ncbi:MAG: hypothetical protein LBB62_09350, partial [Proteiniphilum sp.]|nr:hypothetical protein [Proteiniphilum sp.]
MKLHSLLISVLLLMTVFACGDKIEIPEYNPTVPENPDTPGDSDPGNQPGASANMLRYQPTNYLVWDNWTIVKGDSIHLFHMQGLKIIAYPKDQNLRGYGHAVSGDLLRWTEKPEVLSLYNRVYDNDVDFRFSGSTVEHNGKYYMYYTMRKWAMERIGLAISDDLYHWTIYEGNPVLEPNGRWFITFNAEGTGSNHPLWGYKVDCRDMLVIKDKKGSGYYGYFVSSADRKDLNTPTAVIGIAYSTDMIRWEQKGIVYYPTGVNMPEMIDVFEYQNQWYMTLSSGKDNGGVSSSSDPYIFRAQLYAKAATPEGPFVEDLSDNVIMGGSVNSGICTRSVEYKGKRRVMYTDSNNGSSVLALPKDLGVNHKGQLRLFYASDLLASLRRQKIPASIVDQPNTSYGWPTHGGIWKQQNEVFSCTTDKYSWQGAVFDGLSQNMEFNFTVKSSACDSYGIMLTTYAQNVTFYDHLKYLL